MRVVPSPRLGYRDDKWVAVAHPLTSLPPSRTGLTSPLAEGFLSDRGESGDRDLRTLYRPHFVVDAGVTTTIL